MLTFLSLLSLATNVKQIQRCFFRNIQDVITYSNAESEFQRTDAGAAERMRGIARIELAEIRASIVECETKWGVEMAVWKRDGASELLERSVVDYSAVSIRCAEST